MKKRVLAVLLGGCMVAGLLAGCGGSSSSSSSDSSADTKKADGDSGKGYHFEVVVKSFQSHTGRQLYRESSRHRKNLV